MTTVRVCLVAVGSLAVVAGGVLVGRTAAVAVSFRVDNRVYVGEEREPHGQSTTLFHSGLVYDFLDEPAEITIFDPGRHCFVLLDPTHQVKTEVSTQELVGLCDDLQSWARLQRDPLLRFMAEPRFEERRDEAAGQWVFQSEWMTYRVATAAGVSEAMARQYREFSDWQTRLNVRLKAGSKLPFARLEVNEALDRGHALPREVQLAVRPREGSVVQEQLARSEHSLTTPLGKADLDRIRRTEQLMSVFEPVEFDSYQRAMGRSGR